MEEVAAVVEALVTGYELAPSGDDLGHAEQREHGGDEAAALLGKPQELNFSLFSLQRCSILEVTGLDLDLEGVVTGLDLDLDLDLDLLARGHKSWRFGWLEGPPEDLDGDSSILPRDFPAHLLSVDQSFGISLWLVRGHGWAGGWSRLLHMCRVAGRN